MRIPLCAAHLQQNLAYRLIHPPHRVRDMPVTAPGSLEQSASTSCKRRSKSLVSIARTKVSTTSRAAGRRDCPTGPWRTARAGLAPPVPPVLSGRDQASPIPKNDNPAPAQGADVRKIYSATMVI